MYPARRVLPACGRTPVYMSPELINSKNGKIGYDGRSVDVWASGILLLVMLLGSFPFDHTGGHHTVHCMWELPVSRCPLSGQLWVGARMQCLSPPVDMLQLHACLPAWPSQCPHLTHTDTHDCLPDCPPGP